jgi:hypothetical protein
MADEEEPTQELNNIDNGNVAEQMLLEDDYSHLSAENQDISHAIRGFTPEQHHQINEEDEEEDSESDNDNDNNNNDKVNGNEEDERGNHELFLEAKTMVQLSERVNKKQKKGEGSKIWQFMKPVHFKDGIVTDLQVIDSLAHAKLTKADNLGEYYFCCIVCYNDPEVSLSDCLVFGQTDNNNNSTIYRNYFGYSKTWVFGQTYVQERDCQWHGQFREAHEKQTRRSLERSF